MINITYKGKEYKYEDLDDFYISIGNNGVQVNAVINFVTEENKDKVEEIILKKAIKPGKTNLKNDILVEGISDIKVNLASCCNPVPQDRIVGYITKGYGITVHRAMCPNVQDLEERLIDVSWQETTTKHIE